MLFNSLEFCIFLPIVFVLYWFVFNQKLRLQNCVLLIASYVFYGFWDWRFLFLILLSSVSDYSIGLLMDRWTNQTKRRLLLGFSLALNLGLLGLFKYANFFIESFIDAFSFFGIALEGRGLNIILPVGISFYTFQTLSYTIDVYRKKVPVNRDLIAFLSYVSFFPQLVAGPIERATHLLPQFTKSRTLELTALRLGCLQILWGLFKKVVIADNAAIQVDAIFSNVDAMSGSDLLLGGVYFAFQIYGDFSGYSDIAIGTARLFGFTLIRNFAYPYFSRDIAEFWRRWHISLSSWFRDYLYIPLGGSRGSQFKKIRNTFIIFLVSGFWHGANWTFLAWGLLNALYFLPLLLRSSNRQHLDVVASDRMLPSIKELFQMLFTFFITIIAWIFFRSDSIGDALHYLSQMFSPSLFSMPQTAVFIPMIVVFVIVEWIFRRRDFALDLPLQQSLVYRIRNIVLVSVVFWSIWIWGAFDNKEFIYFQF